MWLILFCPFPPARNTSWLDGLKLSRFDDLLNGAVFDLAGNGVTNVKTLIRTFSWSNELRDMRLYEIIESVTKKNEKYFIKLGFLIRNW